MKIRWPAAICALIFGAIAMPASADVSALYEVQSDDEFERTLDLAMTIEVNASGDARLHITGKSDYFLIRNGEVYTVSRGIDGPYAEKLDDLEAVIANVGQAGGISLELLDQFPKIDLVDKGMVKVGKWKGQGYAQREYDDEVGRPELVLSDDVGLDSIGKAFARLANGRFGTLRALTLTSLFGGFGFYDAKVRDLLNTGTPIRINALELSEVSSDAIDPARFELPERVLTQEEIRQQSQPFDWAPAFDRQPQG